MKTSSKAQEQRNIARLTALAPLGVSGIYAGSQARTGRKVQTGLRTEGRSLATGALGAGAGAGLGALATKGNKYGVLTGAYLGALGGTARGAGKAVRNAQKRGDIKKSAGFVSAFGIQH